jgi:hypothetical protein
VKYQDGPVDTGFLQRLLAAPGAYFASAGKQHQTPDAAFHGKRREGSDRFGGPR